MRPRNLYLTLNGETRTVKEWSKRTQIKSVTIHMRLRAGWSVVETLTTPAAPSTLTHVGRTLVLTEWSRITGLSPCAIRGRLNLGWTIAEALSTPLRARRRRKAGVALNFTEKSPTGAPSNAQHFSQLEISE